MKLLLQPTDQPTLDSRGPGKPENGTSGSARHPIVLRIQSEASILILGYSVIGQILTDGLLAIFTTQCSDSTLTGCEKVRRKVLRLQAVH